MQQDDVPCHFFFVDEAGDLTLFGRRGRNLAGTEGVSRCFMVGFAQIAEPDRLAAELSGLRQKLMADPYLKGIPSMSSGARKTARCFHAKDDCAEVRRDVFALLHGSDISVQVGIKRKSSLEAEARAAGLGWKPDSVYDAIVTTLFKRVLHRAKCNEIVFARRGKSHRAVALSRAIRTAQANCARDMGIVSNRPTIIRSGEPSEFAGLQAVDYFLWALQRLYERGDERYFAFLAEHYSLVMDFDDQRTGKPYGTWYSDQNPLAKQKMLPLDG